MIIIILLIVAIVLFFIVRKIGRIDKEHLNLYIGEAGGGKTLFATTKGMKDLMVNRKWTIKYNRRTTYVNIWRKFRHKELREYKILPVIYANFPINCKYYVPISRDMLLLKEKMIENSIVICDEFGSMASQYQFQEDDLRINLAEFTGKFRHYLGDRARLYIIDQSADRILKEVKYAIGCLYEFQHFRKYGRIYKNRVIKYQNFRQTDMILSRENVKNHYGLLPFKKLYDSRYLKARYGYLVQHQIKYPEDEVLVDLTTDDLIRLGEEKSNLDIIIQREKKKREKMELELKD